MPIPLQIAFQGGGARLALFFGVIKALNELEEKNEIVVTRVAGASAGAIAAVLFAGRANIDALVELHKRWGEGDEIKAAFPDPNDDGLLGKLFSLGKSAIANQPLGDEDRFRYLIEQSLDVAKVKASTIGELDIPCFINCTDIIEHRSLPSPNNQSIVQALLDSAALPFLFRVGGQKIDGGILDNLPIEMLATDNEIHSRYGTVLGISFEADKASPQVRKSTDLAKRLLETVINERVAKSKERLGEENFMELRTSYDELELSTFSVGSYLQVLNRNTISELIKNQTVNWLLGIKDREANTHKKAASTLNVNTNANSVVAELTGFANRCHTKPNCDLVSTIFKVTVNSLEDSHNGFDEVEFIDVFRANNIPVHTYVARMTLGNETLPMNTEIRISDETGNFLKSSQFLLPDSTSKHYWILVMLDQPIPANTEGAIYRVHSKQLQKSGMMPLREKGHDYLSLEVNQSEIAESAQIWLNVPENFPITMENGTWETIDNLDIDCPDSRDSTIVDGEAVASDASHRSERPIGYKTLIWSKKNLNRGEILRVVYKNAI